MKNAAGYLLSTSPNGPRTLVIDVGGTGLKASVLDGTGRMVVPRVRLATPYPCRPATLLRAIANLIAPLPPFDRISSGFPGVIREGRVITAPYFEAEAWRDYPLEAALSRKFGKPARLLNDAEVQGLGIVAGLGLEVVLTLGTGVGSAVFSNGRLTPHLELAHHPIHDDKTYDDYIGNETRLKVGARKWNRRVLKTIDIVHSLLHYDNPVPRRWQRGEVRDRAARQRPDRLKRRRHHGRDPPMGRGCLAGCPRQRRAQWPGRICGSPARPNCRAAATPIDIAARSRPNAFMNRISLVISDVDGTLVTTDKVLTERSRDAVSRLDAAGIGFSLVSSRPPFGLRMLVEPLGLRLPMGAFNGGALVAPDLTRLLPPDAAREAMAVLRSFGVDIWVFADDRWMTDKPTSAYVEREVRTIRLRPIIVANLEGRLDAVGKIVGVSDDFEHLNACEAVARRALGDRASIARSQLYYLDVTPAGTDKGVAVVDLARRLGIPAAGIATIGDMENDVAMFRRSGFSVAMGNASPEVKQLADAVTLSNDQDGFATAVERLVLPSARGISR
jgi:polyphosphate glucokinase